MCLLDLGGGGKRRGKTGNKKIGEEPIALVQGKDEGTLNQGDQWKLRGLAGERRSRGRSHRA